MRICVVNEFFRPHVTGGAELFLEHLIDHLISKGFEIDVVTSQYKGSKKFEKVGNLSIHRVSSSPITIGHFKQLPGITLPFNFFNFRLQRELNDTVKKCDCVYINNLYHLSFAPLQIGRKMGKFILLDVHDYWPICFKKNMLFLEKRFCEGGSSFKCSRCLMATNPISTISYPWLSPLVASEYFLRNGAIRFDKLVVHSKFMGKVIGKGLGKSPKIINYPYFGGKTANKSKTIGDEVNLLFIGRVEYVKGAHLLPRIAQSLKSRGITYEIDVMGTGNMIDELMNVSKKLDLNVRFHGFVKYMSNKFVKIMKKSHILLAPSFWREPFGIIVLEAMAFGMPAIVSNSGGLKEIVTENGVGFSVELNPEAIADKIEYLLNNKRMYSKFSKNGIQNVRKFEPKKIFKEYEKIFKGMS